MASAFRLELVVTRRTVPDASFDDALNKLREIKAFADARGFVQHFAIAISEDIEEGKKQ
jgi:hypothetical protein